jgi:hypothetical protein
MSEMPIVRTMFDERMRKMFAGLLVGIAAMLGMAAPLAHADGPDVGSPCARYQNNDVTTASDGSRIRCTIEPGYFGWTWRPDTGVPAPDLPNGCADCPAPGYIPQPGINFPPPGFPP